MNSKKLLGKVVENWLAKVLSVAAAIVIYVIHLMSNLETHTFNVPLLLQNNAVLVPASSYVRTIKVTVRGEANSVAPGVFQESDIEAYIDLGKYEAAGRYRIPVQVRKKGSAAEIEPLEISVNPLEVYLQLDRKISKNLPLLANMRGKVASGFDLVSHSISPYQVTVEGPLNALEPLTELRTDFIELDGRAGDFSLMVNIINPNSLFVVKGNGMAEFRGLIRPSVPMRNIDGIPIAPAGLDGRFEADFGGKTGSVSLEGNREQLDSFVPAVDFFSVDCSGLTGPGTYTLPVAVSYPPGFSLVKREPEKIEITVTLREESGGDLE